MPRPGIHEVVCEECGTVRELEAGIKSMYCCAKLMVEVEGTKERPEEQQPIRLNPSQ